MAGGELVVAMGVSGATIRGSPLFYLALVNDCLRLHRPGGAETLVRRDRSAR